MCVCVRACVCIGGTSCGLEGIAGCLSSQSLCLLVPSLVPTPYCTQEKLNLYFCGFQGVVISVCQDKKAEH